MMVEEFDAKKYASDFLAHYSSPYYDPVKAHAYYEEHKILVGRAKATALTSKKQKDIFAVSKANIKKAKDAEAKSKRDAIEKKVKDLHGNAEASVASINAALDSLQAAFKDVVYEKPKLNPIPKNATPQQRAYLEKQNASITAATNKKNAQKASDNSRQAGRNRVMSSRKRVQVGKDLGLAVKTARDDYRVAVVAMNKKYQTITANEQKKIHDQVKG